jgi:hypothetical protein
MQMRKFWVRKFFEWICRIPPCCGRTKLFWEWVFALNPDSEFKYRYNTSEIHIIN